MKLQTEEHSERWVTVIVLNICFGVDQTMCMTGTHSREVARRERLVICFYHAHFHRLIISNCIQKKNPSLNQFWRKKNIKIVPYSIGLFDRNCAFWKCLFFGLVANKHVLQCRQHIARLKHLKFKLRNIDIQSTENVTSDASAEGWTHHGFGLKLRLSNRICVGQKFVFLG